MAACWLYFPGAERSNRSDEFEYRSINNQNKKTGSDPAFV
jgi:hypothetical protein